MKRFKLWAVIAVSLALFAIAGAGTYRMRKVQASANLATAPARKGDFLVTVRCRGELAARSSVLIPAPVNVPELRIVWLAPPSSPVNAGDPVIRFDTSSARQQLQEKEAALQEAAASLEHAIAQARITAEEDKRDLAKAQYEVERAKLEASKQEIVSAIQGEESRIDLALAEQKLRVQEATVGLHTASGNAKIASMKRAHEQAQSEVDITKQRLARMEIRAPSAGVIVYLSNYSQGWANAKPFKVGDQVWPGAALAEVPDLATLEMEGKIEEIDRGRITAGQDARVRIDALPELTLTAKMDRISPLTQMTFEWPPTSSFRGYAHILKSDPRLRPGMNGTVDVVIQRLPNVVSVPAKSLFTRRGKPVVYLAEKNRYKPVEVKVLARNPDEVAVEGVPPGVAVTLVDASTQERR
jgi:multidrug efflux pump subunit AcrA (membrane-fusion protein)